MPDRLVSEYLDAINVYVAAGQQFEYYHIDALQKQELTIPAKLTLGFPPDEPRSIYDLTREAIHVLPQLRFVYLAMLLEAFGGDFIAIREGISADENSIRDAIKAEQAHWQSIRTGRMGSTSFLNPAFVAFVMKQRYGFDFSALQELFWEVGVLRHVIAHHNGIIRDESYLAGLTSVTGQCGIENKVGNRITMTGELLFKFIEASRQYLNACH